MFIWLANYMRQRLDKCRNTQSGRERHKEKELTGERDRERGKGSAVNASSVFKK